MKVGIVCGGGNILKDGTLLPPVKNRDDKAIEEYFDGEIQKIIMTGANESIYMAQYAIKHDVPEEDVLIENRSLTTRGNLMETRIRYLDKKEWKEGEIISSYWHGPRVEKLIGWMLPESRGYNFVAVPSIDQRIKSEIEVDRNLERIKLAEDAATIGLGWVYWPDKMRSVYDELELKLMKVAI